MQYEIEHNGTTIILEVEAITEISTGGSGWSECHGTRCCEEYEVETATDFYIQEEYFFDKDGNEVEKPDDYDQVLADHRSAIISTLDAQLC